MSRHDDSAPASIVLGRLFDEGNTLIEGEILDECDDCQRRIAVRLDVVGEAFLVLCIRCDRLRKQ